MDAWLAIYLEWCHEFVQSTDGMPCRLAKRRNRERERERQRERGRVRGEERRGMCDVLLCVILTELAAAAEYCTTKSEATKQSAGPQHNNSSNNNKSKNINNI